MFTYGSEVPLAWTPSRLFVYLVAVVAYGDVLAAGALDADAAAAAGQPAELEVRQLGVIDGEEPETGMLLPVNQTLPHDGSLRLSCGPSPPGKRQIQDDG